MTPSIDRLSVSFFLDSPLPDNRSPEDFFSGHVGLSGSDGTSLRVARALAERGHLVRVYNHHWQRASCGVEFIEVESAGRFLHHVDATSPDAVVFNYYVARPAALEIARSRLKSTRKLLWDQNGADFRFLEAVCRGDIDGIVAVSYSAREWFRSTSAFPRTRVIYNLCDDAFFQPIARNPDGRSILFVGALRPVKGFHALAATWPLVHRAMPEARLIVAGSDTLHERRSADDDTQLAAGDYFDRVIRPFRDWASSEGANVEFLGTISPERLVQLHSECVCCVVNPSAAGAGETFCCSAAEAQLCGNPVISIRHGSLPEVALHGISSLLVRPGSREELGAAILRLLSEPNTVMSMSEAAGTRARQLFARSDIVDRWEQAIRGEPAPCAAPFKSHPVRRAVQNLLRVTGLGDVRRRRRQTRIDRLDHSQFPFEPFHPQAADRAAHEERL